VIENHVIFGVEPRFGHLRGYGHSDGISNPLPQGSRRCFDSRRFMEFRMSGRFALQLAKILQLLQGEIISRHVKPSVKKHAAVPGRKYKTITIDPCWILGIISKRMAK